MTDGPTIAVVIPTHDRPNHLEETLGRVYQQRRLPDEVIVVSDRGDSPTADTVTDFADRTPSPRLLVQTEFRGPSHSRNVGARASRASHIAFLDDDDFWEPDYLATAEATLAGTPTCDLVIAGLAVSKDGSLEPYRMVPPNLRSDHFYWRNPGVNGSNIVVARSLFEKIDGFDPELSVSNDKDFMIRALKAGAHPVATGQWHVVWNRHGEDQITSFTSRRRAHGARRFLRKHGAAMPAKLRRRVRGRVAVAEFGIETRWWRKCYLLAEIMGSGALRNLSRLRKVLQHKRAQSPESAR